MKLSINSKDLLRTTNTLAGLIKNQNTLPILDNILLEVVNGKIIFTVDNLETRGKIELNVETTEEVKVCVPFKLFSNIIKVFPNAPVELVFTDKNLSLNSATGSYNIPIVDAKDYPQAKEKEETIPIKLNALDLKEGLKKALLFTEKINVTNCDNVLIGIDTSGIRIASTNGGSIIFEYSMKGSGETKDIVISRSVASFISNSIVHDEEIELSYSDNSIFLKLENIEINSIVLDITFPNYRGVFEKCKFDKILNVDKDIISSAIKRLYSISDESNRTVIFDVDQNNIEISFKNDFQKYDAKETLNCDYTGEKVKIGFNSNYMNNILTSIEDDIQMHILESDKPCLFKAENIRAILAPIRIHQ